MSICPTLLRLAAIASAILSASVIVTTAPASAEPTCSDVEVIFGRGTSEAPGIGRVGQALVDAMTPLLGSRTISSYGMVYPATYDFLAAADGANDVRSRMTFLAQACPNTRVVLGGYSQGAAAIDMLAGVPPLGNKIGEVGSAAPLPPTLDAMVAAVAVFGNPSAKFSLPLDSTGAFAGRAIDVCSDGDPICSRGRNPFAHTHYETSDLIGQAAAFVVRFI